MVATLVEEINYILKFKSSFFSSYALMYHCTLEMYPGENAFILH